MNDDVDLMVKAVRDMADQLRQYENRADEHRQKLLDEVRITMEATRAGVDATIRAFRHDVHLTTGKLQMDAAMHRDEHSAERKERANDSLERITRQTLWNAWMGGLTALVVINLGLLIFVVAAMYARGAGL